MQLSNSIAEGIQTTTVGHYRKLPNGPGETTTEEQSKDQSFRQVERDGMRLLHASNKSKGDDSPSPNSKAELLRVR
ncbi:unnamed protein product [Sphagnum jensenii]|jgi:hypothetical protein|uniref:Uncharacterized protein n=1 Tax=Sphagnum jensenii TaxID=128206 RepID=A0ABP0VQV0_9BRYO